MMLMQGEEQIVTEMDTAVLETITAPPPEPSPIEMTNGMLEALYNVGLKRSYQFIASVDFNRKSVVVYSLIPDVGFRKRGDVFQKIVELEISPKKANKSFGECFELTKKYEITETNDDSIRVEIHKLIGVEELNEFLKNLRGCPVEIRGTIKFSDLLRRQADLLIILHAK